ncbi:SAM-dependent methyltransferase [Streptomyces sp. NPDC003006]
MPHPFSNQVGAMYDQLTDLSRTIHDDNLHYGYWADPQSQEESLAEATDRMTDQLITRLDAHPGQRVLDIGCGTGKPALRLARETGADVTGITVSRHQVGIANAAARAQALHHQVRFCYADAMDLPYPDASFDHAWALESMLHMPDRGHVLRETARVLRPGARLVIADIVLRAPIPDDDTQALIDQFTSIVHSRGLERIDTYPALIEAADLQLLQLTDITAHTQRTLHGMIASFRTIRAHDAAMNEDHFTQSLRCFETIATLPHVGYALMTARKA